MLFALGVGSSAPSAFNSAYYGYPKALTDAGYPVLTADMSDPTPGYQGFTFGNDDCIGGADAAWTQMKSATGVGARADKMWLVGISGGTSTFLNWAIRHPTNVAGMALALPILRLDDAYQNDTGGYRSEIATAYGGLNWPTDPIPALATHDPNSYSNVDKAKLTMPIHLWTGGVDPYTTTVQAQAWAASVNALTGLGNVVVESFGPLVGHDFSLFTPAVMLAWLDSVGGRA